MSGAARRFLSHFWCSLSVAATASSCCCCVHRQSFHFDTEDTGPAYTQVQIQHRSRAPGPPMDPLTTAVLDQPPGRAAKRLNQGA